MLLFFAIIGGLFATYLFLITIQPLFERGQVTSEEWDRIEDESSALLARRNRLVEELRDLEFEASLNKIEGEDLERLRRRYEKEALALMAILEEDAKDFDHRIDTDLKLAIEAARRRKNERRADAVNQTDLQPSEEASS